MSTLSPLNIALPLQVTSLSNATQSIASTAASESPDPGSTIVTIPSPVNEAPLLYTPLGTLSGDDTITAWGNSDNTDSISQLMAGNAMAGSMSGQFARLGGALLDRFQTTGDNFSQSVTVSSASAGLAVQDGQGEVDLTVQTASGTKVQIDMESKDGTLTVNLNSSGTLTGTERSALAKLADGFQKAIDGLDGVPPQLNLSGLMQYDPSVLSSVNLQVNVSGEVQGNISAKVSLSSSARSVSLADASGTINLNVNTSDSAIWGSTDQRNQAIQSYLAQFDNANAQGHGDTALMSLFKDAFSQMNGDYGTSTQQLPGTDNQQWIAQSDQAMLTGLADFSASITDTTTAPNPVMPSETDTFAYQVSQSTQTQGDWQNGQISQTQHSHLQASYHQAVPGHKLEMGKSPESQNYEYVKVSDDASSATNIATQRGAIVQATLNQSSSGSTETSEYLKGVLKSDVTTPTKTSESKDLLALLQPFMTNDGAKDDSESWQQQLSQIHAMVLLNSGTTS
jgi:uncharacterized protein YndB with AHSA1/START domain